jgi:hypothetical protein
METIKNNPNLTKMWLKTLDDDFIKTREKSIVGKTNGTGLFYLYIAKSLLTDELLRKGLAYLNGKDLHGKTSLQVFEEYLAECKITAV